MSKDVKIGGIIKNGDYEIKNLIKKMINVDSVKQLKNRYQC